MKQYMVTSKSGAFYHNEYFDDEKSAREYANCCYKRGDMIIELFHHHRDGYHSVQRIVRKFEGSPLYETK